MNVTTSTRKAIGLMVAVCVLCAVQAQAASLGGQRDWDFSKTGWFKKLPIWSFITAKSDLGDDDDDDSGSPSRDFNLGDDDDDDSGTPNGQPSVPEPAAGLAAGAVAIGTLAFLKRRRR